MGARGDNAMGQRSNAWDVRSQQYSGMQRGRTGELEKKEGAICAPLKPFRG